MNQESKFIPGRLVVGHQTLNLAAVVRIHPWDPLTGDECMTYKDILHKVKGMNELLEKLIREAKEIHTERDAEYQLAHLAEQRIHQLEEAAIATKAANEASQRVMVDLRAENEAHRAAMNVIGAKVDIIRYSPDDDCGEVSDLLALFDADSADYIGEPDTNHKHIGCDRNCTKGD